MFDMKIVGGWGVVLEQKKCRAESKSGLCPVWTSYNTCSLYLGLGKLHENVQPGIYTIQPAFMD